jgi:hypothetical protein
LTDFATSVIDGFFREDEPIFGDNGGDAGPLTARITPGLAVPRPSPRDTPPLIVDRLFLPKK